MRNADVRGFLSDRVGSLRQWCRGAKLGLRYRLASIPAWVMVLTVAGIVGAASSVTAVALISRWRNRSANALKVSSTPPDEVGVESVN